MKRLFQLSALLFLFASCAHATCTGSSPNWTATPDAASINTCITNAVTGDTITVTAGTISGNTSLMSIPASKGITIIASGAVIISTTGQGFQLNAGASTTRISGFTCNNPGNVPTDSNGHCLRIFTGPGNATYRIDHWTMCSGGGTCTTANTIFIDINGVGPGLFDHNTLSGNGSSFIQSNGTGSNQTVTTEWMDDVIPGGSNMLFFEDNTFTDAPCVGVSGCASTSNGWIQGVGGTRTVIRHNTINMLNIDQHGSQNGGNECSPSGFACTGNVGVRWYEIYNNNFVLGMNASWFSYMDLRAGSGVVFNNTITGSNGSWGFIRIYEENTLAWPQAYQPGSGKGDITSPHTSCVSGTQNTTPIYLWQGTGSQLNTGSTIPTAFNLVFNNGSSNTVGNVQLNRDLFVSATQPATLRKIEASGDTCATTYNYTPFTYPHPLVNSTIPTVAITAPTSGSTASGASVALTGTCVPTGATITTVQFQIDGTNYSAAGSASPYSPAAWDSTKASNANHVIGFSCTDSNGLTNSTSEVVTASNSSPGCFTSSNNFSTNQIFNAAAASFTLTLTVRPNTSGVNSVVGLSNGAAVKDTDLAAIVLFNPNNGLIQVRDGGSYRADNVVNWVTSTVYTLAIAPNVTAHTYSVTETSPSNVVLCASCAFRTEQASVSGLDHINAQGLATPNTVQVCNPMVSPVIAVSPATLAFGSVTQNTLTPPTLTGTLSNISFPSGEVLTGSYFTITGPNAADFTNPGTGTCANNLTVAGQSSCTANVTFTPTATPGTNETATLNLFGTVNASIPLSGTSQAPPTSPAGTPAIILGLVNSLGAIDLEIGNCPKTCKIHLACTNCTPTYIGTVR